jgi:hypothetical protein
MRLKKAMAAEYKEISIGEMDVFMKRAFHALHPKRAQFSGIYYYDLRLSSVVAIRVWTSIGVRSESAKDSGEGSIKVRLVSRKDNKGLEGKKEAIVKRTQGWRDNLTDRVETLIEKYDERAEWWDKWAETRSRGDDADRAYQREEQGGKLDRTEEERAREEDGEGDEGPSEPAAPPVKQYDAGRMQGGITDPQINFLRVLMRGMTQGRWEAAGAPKITGLDEPPNGPSEVRGLTKGQASLLIDALKRGPSRYASTDVSDCEATPYAYDSREPKP